MALPIALLVAASIAPCVADLDHADLVREIDAAIVMPKFALPSYMYARYYALRSDGRIAVLLNARVALPKPLGPLYRTAFSEDDYLLKGDCPTDGEPIAGERYWVDEQKMPPISDGGCQVIRLVYDPRLHRVGTIDCSGLRKR